MTAPAAEARSLSAECTLAERPEYKGLHGECRRTKDISLPGTTCILLQPRCGCSCHGSDIAWSGNTEAPHGTWAARGVFLCADGACPASTSEPQLSSVSRQAGHVAARCHSVTLPVWPHTGFPSLSL